RDNGERFGGVGKRKRNCRAMLERDLRSKTVGVPNKFDFAAQNKNAGADVDLPSELSVVFDFRRGPAVIEPRTKIDNHFDFAFFASNLPDELVLRPKQPSLILFRFDRHELDPD